jgi:broad specificity phosphatase PhoE
MKRLFSKKARSAPKNTYLYRVKELSDYVDTYFREPISPHEKKVMLIRHAWSIGNDRHLLYGLTDYDLTPLGVQQAIYLQSVMTKHKSDFTAIYSSKLKRTYATGGISLSLGDSPSVKDIIRDERFNELDLGPLEGIHSGKMDGFEHEIFFHM